MKPPYDYGFRLVDQHKTLFHVLLLVLLPAGIFDAAAGDPDVIEIRLGDYRFEPAEVQLAAGRPAILRLINTDTIVPHNFSLSTSGHGADVDVDILGGESVEVRLGPLPAGRYPFHCNKKMVFMKSHREKGMEGSLTVTPE